MKTIRTIIIALLLFKTFVFCASFDRENQLNESSGLSKIERDSFPDWARADSLVGRDARFGDLWCETASGKEIDFDYQK